MKKSLTAVARAPILGRAMLMVYRARMPLRYVLALALDVVRWLFTSKEVSNFTYDLTENNKRCLAALIADVMDIEFGTVMEYIREIEEDEDLKGQIRHTTAGSDFGFTADKEVRFGRRIGWYAVARALKPHVIVETGVDKGLGACVLTAALKRNREEGHEGKYYGTDINPKAGYLLSGEYAGFGRILYGDSIKSLGQLEDPIDLFINDSDHSADYEGREYEAIADQLAERAIVLGDNSHCTDELLNFSLKTGRRFVFFSEKPSAHWYPGAGIGISFTR